MINRIYEYFDLKRKYNTLQIKYEAKCDELENKIIQCNNEKKTKLLQRDLYENKIKELIEINIDIQKEIVKLKKEIKELKKGDRDGSRTIESKRKVKS